MVTSVGLTVTGALVLPVVTDSGTSVATAASGFLVNAATQVVKTANIITISLALERTGASIVADAQGNIPDTLACAILAGYRPNTAYGTNRMVWSFSTGTVGGTLGLNPSTGQVELLTLNSGSTLGTGGILRSTLSFPA
jgi:hypothetical protein